MAAGAKGRAGLTNYEAAWLFLELADRVEVAGDNPFKAVAYRKAARLLEGLPEPFAEAWAAGRLKGRPGIGEAIHAKLGELIQTGTMAALERLRREIPPGVMEMLTLPGVGPRHARTFWKELGLEDLASLRRAAEERRLRTVKGLGPKLELAVLRSLSQRDGAPSRQLLGLALPLARELQECFSGLPAAQRVEIAGSVRRRCELVGDVDLVVATGCPEEIGRFFLGLPTLREAAIPEFGRLTAVHRSGVGLEVILAEPREFPAIWLRTTGSKAHYARLRRRAEERGLLDGRGLIGGGRAPVDEEGIYRLLGLAYVPPELREDRGEFEAAEKGELPALIREDDLRGDLHLHTEWSDGTASLREMREAAARLGYEYLAVCDHSRSLAIAHGLDGDRLRAQRREIAELNAEGHPVQLLAGVEVDILADGRLDLEDDLLAESDLVVASIHSGFRQEPERLFARAAAALRHPHVDILAHPTGRLLGHRPPYALDVPALIELAVETGTVLEINASPDRLDLADVYVRQVVEAGGLVAIDTDAHSPDHLAYREYGVATARRGWCEARNVLNTRPLGELLAWLSLPKEQRFPA
ncbi:MAG TPA: DNA polymerase/3'-5' exonuclease PolX [Firmicutes bacterium]|nr:DNA polymerase/3'-5' exonuclease PolX [Bacillota bacterium]